jgi:hemerythrin-like domain-containing protein
MQYKGFSANKTGWHLHAMPIGYLMIEHRLIERMVGLLKAELHRIEKKNQADLDLINAGIDFIRTYADKCHHGKEEDILFKELLKKSILPAHKRGIDELIEEHKLGRKAVARLVSSCGQYSQKNSPALKDIKKEIKWLTEFYPAHISKEDKGYFIPFMSY